MSQSEIHVASDEPVGTGRFPAFESPFLHAPEGARTIFLVTLAAACGPLLGGIVLFGWRAALVAAISIVSCAAIERAYFFVSRTPALLGRSHAYLTGMLLALTLPAYVPWYVPVVASAFAIIVGKGIFGGVGHFIWQPALVGRLAAAVLFSTTLISPLPDRPTVGPILAPSKMLVGNIRSAGTKFGARRWRGESSPIGQDALLVERPEVTLKSLTSSRQPGFSGLASRHEASAANRPLAIMSLPPIDEMIIGARPGGIGETCVVVILVAGLYLVYRNYVRLHLPLAFIVSAGCVAAVSPVYFAGIGNTVIKAWPLASAEHLGTRLDAGLIYVAYQLLSGEFFLAAFFLATETTSRPVTGGGQVIYAVTGGALAMLLKLHVDMPIPAYMAVLAANTMTIMIDSFWRPRVFGQKRFAFLRRNKQSI